jgi:hypothetical protein
MTPEEMFDRAYDAAMQDRKGLIAFLDGITEAQARWRPPDGEWSILEGLEHVMLTETYMRNNLLRLLRDAEAHSAWDNAPENPIKMSAEALRRREQGFVGAPEELEPQGGRDFQEMRLQLLSDRETSQEALAAFRQRDLSRLVLSHPRYGQRHVYDVIEYSGIHDYLHCEQMQRVTRSPDYPATGA